MFAPGTGTGAAASEESLESARAEASDTAAKIEAAQTDRAAVEEEITRDEAEIGTLRARADELRVRVRRRAARLYVRMSTARLDAVVNTDNVIDASRAAHLTSTAGDHDMTAATELQDLTRVLEDRQVQLRARQDELDRTIESLVALRAQLQNRVERAVTAYQHANQSASQNMSQNTSQQVSAQPVVEGDVWATFRECTFAFESGGNYQIVSRDGLYYGAWQFAIGTWNAVASRMGRDDLVGVLPSQASPADQDAVAHALWLESGNRPWGGRC